MNFLFPLIRQVLLHKACLLTNSSNVVEGGRIVGSISIREYMSHIKHFQRFSWPRSSVLRVPTKCSFLKSDIGTFQNLFKLSVLSNDITIVIKPIQQAVPGNDRNVFCIHSMQIHSKPIYEEDIAVTPVRTH